VTAGTKDNVITLTGHVRTWAEHDAVLGAAWMAYGVIDVRDELQVTGWWAVKATVPSALTGPVTPPWARWPARGESR
jgi:BON domain